MSGIADFFSFGRKTSGLDREQSLLAIPVVNNSVKVIEERQGGIILSVLVRRGEGFLSRFQPEIMQRRLELDEIGAYVFKLIDGKRSTLEIINIFVENFRINRREGELSCVEFMKSLMRRHVISILVPKHEKK